MPPERIPMLTEEKPCFILLKELRTALKEYEMELKDMIEQLKREGRLGLEDTFYQHGSTTVLEHSIQVAELSCRIARRLNWGVDYEVLMRGALLHDYFLYDWHEQDDGRHRLHGFTHPYMALRNAMEDFDLTEKEMDIIRHHMFPLVPVPPHCREAWIVCIADKLCASRETAYGFWEKAVEIVK